MKISLRQWTELFGDFPGRPVADDRIGEARIVTAWLGVNPDPQPSQIFGSAVFVDSHVVEEHESTSAVDARATHARLVERWRSANNAQVTDS